MANAVSCYSADFVIYIKLRERYKNTMPYCSFIKHLNHSCIGDWVIFQDIHACFKEIVCYCFIHVPIIIKSLYYSSFNLMNQSPTL